MNQKQKLSDLLSELKTDYLDKLPNKIAELGQVTALKDWDKLEELYHNLKGTGKTYGFPELSLVCEAMEYFLIHTKNDQEMLAEIALQVLEQLLSKYSRALPVELNNIENATLILNLKK